MKKNKNQYIQANRDWLVAKSQEDGVKALPKGVYYKVLSEGDASSAMPTPSNVITAHYTGKVAGKEIVQLYIGDLECSVDRPRKELKNFVKLDLAPGETKMAEFTITLDDLKYYSENIHGWAVEPGAFRAYLSTNSSDEGCYVEFSY